MTEISIKNERDYLDYVKIIKSFSKDESVNDLARHKATINTNQDVIGVAMANIRKLAKQVFKGGYDSFLEVSLPKTIMNQTYEETLIEGLVIAQIKSQEIQFKYLEKWLPKIDNWATCDSTTSSFKHSKMNDEYFPWFYEKCFSSEEFIARFGITIIMNNFLDKKYLDQIFDMCESVKNDAYYVKMAIAWLVSFCFMKYRDETLEFLKRGSLDKFTHNKSISKCRDSYQVSPEDKELLKILRK